MLKIVEFFICQVEPIQKRTLNECRRFREKAFSREGNAKYAFFPSKSYILKEKRNNDEKKIAVSLCENISFN